MHKIPIPDQSEAARLRALYQDNPIIRTAVDALGAFGAALSARQAAVLLPMWCHFDQLTEREARAVVAWFVLPALGAFPINAGQAAEVGVDWPELDRDDERGGAR